MAVEVKIDDRVFRELQKKVGSLKSAFAKVGVLQSKGGGEMSSDGETTLAELAAIHEYGAPRANIPARSFVRRTFTEVEGKEELGKFLAKIAKQVVSERVTVEQALDQVGAWGAAAVKRRIKMGIPPPLRPATVKAKGSSTPLVDTGQLLNAITWEVKE